MDKMIFCLVPYQTNANISIIEFEIVFSVYWSTTGYITDFKSLRNKDSSGIKYYTGTTVMVCVFYENNKHLKYNYKNEYINIEGIFGYNFWH